jgi:hypothetical protein
MKREWEESFIKAKVSRFSDRMLRKEAWFHVANDLAEAMAMLEPRIEEHWQKVNAQLDARDSEEPPLGLVTVHMMLAAFAIENLCKGFLVDCLTAEEEAQAKTGVIPKSFKDHDILALIERVGMLVSDSEKYLLEMIRDAGWRGRYPIPTVHKKIQPFTRFGSGVRRTKAILQRLRRHVGAHESTLPKNEPKR